MNNDINFPLLQELQCYLFPGRDRRCQQQYLAFYHKAYFFLKEIMCEAFLSEGLKEEVRSFTSDDFFRHEEFVCLFHGDCPVATLMFDWMDLHSPVSLEHSYFKPYPVAIINSLKKEHRFLMTIGHLAVHPEWRAKKMGKGVADIITGLMTRRFLSSSASILVFFTRNNRGTHKLGYEHGGQPIMKKVTHYGVDADLIAIYRDSVKQSSLLGIAELTDQIWQQAIYTNHTSRCEYE